MSGEQINLLALIIAKEIYCNYKNKDINDICILLNQIIHNLAVYSKKD